MSAPVLPFRVVTGGRRPRRAPASSSLQQAAARLEQHRPEHVAYVTDLINDLLRPDTDSYPGA